SISNLLSLVGANRAVLELNNIIALRDLRKNINRKTNFESANLARQAVASVNRVQELKKLNINLLPKGLKEVAIACIKNPELSLEVLSSDLGITKSCLNHRLRALKKIVS
ncbi:MAG: DNA-binding protein WhiA, partial [Firmicutes bacterium]|nr:DNA-binding protein WhiA [Bacillota bacterium]